MATFLLVIIYTAFISLGLPDALLGAGWPAMHTGFGVPIGYVNFQMISGRSFRPSGRILRRWNRTGHRRQRRPHRRRLASPSSRSGGSSPPRFPGLAGPWTCSTFVAAHYESRHMSWLPASGAGHPDRAARSFAFSSGAENGRAAFPRGVPDDPCRDPRLRFPCGQGRRARRRG